MAEAILSTLKDILLSSIPLFVAMDPVGNLPFVLSLTEEMRPWERSRTVRLAILTALGVGLGFLALGKGVFLLLAISESDFLVAGGVVLFAFATRNLLTEPGESRGIKAEDRLIGVVPLGTPLLVGPAALATLLLLMNSFSITVALVALAINLLVAWLIFAQANRIARFLGRGGLKAVDKVASLLLAAIAVKLVRQGIVAFLS